MDKEEFKPNIGKKLFSTHQLELEQSLSQFASILGMDSNADKISDFFTAFMSGFWDPFEEVCKKCNQGQREISAKIMAHEANLFQALDSEHKSILDHYSALVTERNIEALDYAFLVGYQSAFRFLMMGLFSIDKVIQSTKEEREDGHKVI